MKNTLKPYTANLFLLLTYLLCGITIDCFSQVSPQGLTSEMLLPQFSNLTPEAASLGRYGAFQVSEYSGAVNISIPLYTVKSGDISFPINLYYDGTGIKVEQDATFVGLGWNLSYGGIINHIVCGHDDFQDEYQYRGSYWKKFWEGTNSLPQDYPCENYYHKPIAFPLIGTEPGINNEDEFFLYDNLVKGYDIPDVFQVCFCGNNISFIIDPRAGKGSDGQDSLIILNDNSQKYKISYQMKRFGAFNYPSSFTITDDKGTNFLFSAYTENVFSYAQVDSYYLTKVYGSDGMNGKNVISIKYDQKNFYFGKYSRPITKSHKATSERISAKDDDIPHEDGFSSTFTQLLYGTWHTPELGCGENGACNKVYPKRIITALDTVEFKKGERQDIVGAQSIKSIIVKSITGNVQKKIDFVYDYFHEDSPKDYYSGKRLKLTSLTIDDQKYQFLYDDKKLPAFSSYSKDYWGYYNGANPDATCFEACTPAYTISNNVVLPEKHLDGSNRLASEELCNVGMLKRVIYPTGGYTDYEFEANRFNDKYYYPDAKNSNISFPVSINSTIDCSVQVDNHTREKSGTFTASQKDHELKIEGVSMDSYDKLEITIKNSSNSFNKTFYRQGPSMGNDWNGRLSLSLNAGETYTMSAKLTSVKSPSVFASCTISHEAPNPNVTASPTTKNEKGGYSIGGGLRIKSIKNYDSNNAYLNGVEYEYMGGRLLSPTPQLEIHTINFQYAHVEYMPSGWPVESEITKMTPKVSFLYANTEPSYPYICSLGIPASVGYDMVTQKEIDKSGKVLRETISEFYNYGYMTNNYKTKSNVQNSFYFNSYYNDTIPLLGHLNGKKKKETVYSEMGVPGYEASYSYSVKKMGSVLYPKCVPNHLSGFKTILTTYDLAFFRKFITWSYLTKKDETFYDANGNKTTSRVTTYTYDDSNYQVSQQTVSDGQNTESVRYWYPLNSGNPSNGLSYLINRNCLSEVTGVETYRNGIFTGGSKFNYTTNNIGIPVVEACYSIFPNRECIQQMKVTGYDNYGNIREYEKKDGTPVTILWSYSHQYPVMEIVGKRYDDIKSDDVDKMEDPQVIPMPTENQIRSVYNTIRTKNPDAHVTAYIYTPWHTISSIITPNGYETHYGYDDFGRLKEASDFTGILQKYQYNYKIK